jgi:hypothetical protein
VPSSESENELESTEPEDLLSPEIMMDDDEVKKLLGQSTRHVLTNFDNLLMRLHRSRQYHTSGSTVNTTKPVNSRPPKRKRRSTTNESPRIIPEHDGIEDQERVTGRDYLKHPSGKNPLYPRDWSEVLGVASLTGWNPAVIDRAAKRCSALFGERTLLRTMPETAAGKAEDRMNEYTPEMIPDFDLVDDMEEEENPIGRDEVEVGFRCPEDSCPQHHRLYEKRFMIRQHLRRVHKYGQEALDAYDQACALRDTKPSVEPLQTEMKKEDDGASDDDQSEMIAAVREDGYMKPVELHLGRGTDVQDRKKRGEGRS